LSTIERLLRKADVRQIKFLMQFFHVNRLYD